MPLSVNELPNDVAPGDLIRAVDFNAVLAWLRDLEDRVAALEGADESVAITAILPAGPIRIGDTIEILGRNLGFQIGAHRVYFNSTRATVFGPESSDTRLVVTVPNVPGVSETSPPVMLTVGNQTTVATATITLRPAVSQQQGSLSLQFTGVEISGREVSTIPAGSTVTFTYNLGSDALLATTARIAPKISVPEWEKLLEVLDAKGNLLTVRAMDLKPGQQTAFGIQLPAPAASAGTKFTLAVSVEADDLPAVTDSQTFTVTGV